MLDECGWDGVRVGRGFGVREFCFIEKRQQENHISVSVSICQGWMGAESRGGREGGSDTEEDKVSGV